MVDHDQLRASMTAAVHAQALELAAAAIDFELSADEAAELRRHLDECETCRTDAQLLRSDAAAIATLPGLDAPERVRTAVLAGRAPRRIGSIQPIAVAVIVAVLTLVPLSATFLINGGFSCCGGGGAAGSPAVATPHVEASEPAAATAAPTMPPSSSAPEGTPPPPTPSPTPSPSPSPTPTVAPDRTG